MKGKCACLQSPPMPRGSHLCSEAPAPGPCPKAFLSRGLARVGGGMSSEDLPSAGVARCFPGEVGLDGKGSVEGPQALSSVWPAPEGKVPGCGLVGWSLRLQCRLLSGPHQVCHEAM